MIAEPNHGGAKVVPMGRDHPFLSGWASQERVPAVSIETEQALLGAVLMNPDAFARVSAIAKPEHFYSAHHQMLFSVIAELAEAGVTPTVHTIRDALGPGADADMGGLTLAKYVARLRAEATTVVLAPEYAREVRNYWALREIASAARLSTDGSPFVSSVMLTVILERIDEVRASLHDIEKRSASIDQAAGELVEAIGAGSVANSRRCRGPV